MSINHFLTFLDLTEKDFEKLLSRTRTLKQNDTSVSDVLSEKSIVLLFEKPSTRTRTSFEVGIHQLGGQPLTLRASEIQLSRGEPVKDIARVFTRYCSGLVARVYNHEDLEELTTYGSIPVINALSDYTHPCQILADFFTIREEKGSVEDQTICYIGDGNNVCRSLILGTAIAGNNLTISAPEGYEPGEEIVEKAREKSKKTLSVSLVRDPAEAVRGADIVYTDVWTSMGQEEEQEQRRNDFQSYQINRDLLKHSKSDVSVMHCLPAHRGEEITDDVMEGNQTIVWRQAENRLHAQKALLDVIYQEK